jgi:hypothetical protein
MFLETLKSRRFFSALSNAGELTNFTLLFWINIGHNPSNNFLLALEYAARI